jgi:hypothetical protein
MPQLLVRNSIFSPAKFNCFNALFAFLCLAVVSGCGGPSTVNAVPRPNTNQPDFGPFDTVVKSESGNGFDLSFIHDDHFACVSINIQKVIENPDLADVPWATIESQVAELIGQDNAALENLNRIWILVDRKVISSSGQPNSPLVYVVDLKNSLNRESLANAFAKNDGDQKESMSVKELSKKRVVIGAPDFVEKISDQGGQSSMVSQLQKMKLDSDVDGIVDILPVRNTLQGIVDTVAQFGGKSFEVYSRLPDALQRIELSLALSEDETFHAVAHIDDEVLTKELADLTNEGMQSGGGGGMMGGMPFGMGGLGGGMGGGNVGESSPRVMIEPVSARAMEEVGKEITEEGLFTVVGKEKRLTFSLKRPKNLNELIKSTLVDAQNQFALGIRVGKLNKIAAALKAYDEKYDCFPPSGVVAEGDETLPAQFNWRVGLLPFMDEQELYDRFDFSEPWDSPKNLEVANEIPDVFAVSDFDGDQKSAESARLKTRFHVLGNGKGVYQVDKPKKSEISDKKIWTAVLVEGNESSAIEWTKPGSLAMKTPNVEKFGNADENGVLFVNAAFAVRAIVRDQEKFSSIVSAKGGEILKRTDFMPLAPVN